MREQSVRACTDQHAAQQLIVSVQMHLLETQHTQLARQRDFQQPARHGPRPLSPLEIGRARAAVSVRFVDQMRVVAKRGARYQAARAAHGCQLDARQLRRHAKPTRQRANNERAGEAQRAQVARKLQRRANGGTELRVLQVQRVELRIGLSRAELFGQHGVLAVLGLVQVARTTVNIERAQLFASSQLVRQTT